MWTAKFWKQAGERAIKTAAQTAVGLMSGDGLGILEVDWMQIGSVALLAAITSILTSVASSNVGPNKGTPDII